MSAVVDPSVICPLARSDVLQAQHRLNAGKREAVTVELRRIDVHAHRGQRRRRPTYLPHSLDLRELLLHDCRSFVVQLARVVFVRSQPENHDRRIRRIHFAIGGIGGQIRGQIGAGGIDRRLNVARRAIDVTAQIELDGDSGGAERTRRRSSPKRRRCARTAAPAAWPPKMP